MSTQQQTNKTPRRSNRKHKQHNTSLSQARPAFSDNELSQTQDSTNDFEPSSGNNLEGKKPHTRRNTRGLSTGEQHHQISQNISVPEKTKATPIKQAYAGPTFHQSPAPSALPLPSFYSRSVPTTNSAPPSRLQHKATIDQGNAGTERQESPTRRENTPLDFLFEAARNARGTLRSESPSTRSMNLSVHGGSPAGKSPAPRDPESVFPFELDGGSTPGEDGASFATPYKDRLEALKTTRSTSAGVRSLDENERRAKTNALKKLLMHSQNQDGHETGMDMHNPFNAKVPQPQTHLNAPRPQYHHHSSPSTPAFMQNYQTSTSQQYFPNMPGSSGGGSHLNAINHPMLSNLRNVYDAKNDFEPAELTSDNPITPPRLPAARNQGDNLTSHYAYRGQETPSNQKQSPVPRSTPTAQQLENDLRRVLKLDLTSQG